MADRADIPTFGETVTFYSDRHPSQALRTSLNAQYVTTRQGYLSVAIEIAPITRLNTAPSWDNKITLQLTKAELIAFCQVLFGLKAEAKGAFHGDNKNKGIAAYDNGPDGVGVTVSEKGVSYMHQLTPDNRIELSVFVLRRLAESWKVTPTDTIALLRQFALMGRQPRRSAG